MNKLSLLSKKNKSFFKNFSFFIVFGLILSIVLSAFIFTIYFFQRDLNNEPIKNLTTDYDWMAYIGSFLTFISTTILGLVAFWQNKNLSATNDKLVISNLKTDGYSKIKVYKEQFLYARKDDTGFVMKKQNNEKKPRIFFYKKLVCEDKNEEDIRFLINLEEENKKILKDFTIESFDILYNDLVCNFEEVEPHSFKPISISYNFETEERKLQEKRIKKETSSNVAIKDKEDEEDKDIYYMTVICKADKEIVDAIKKSRYLRLQFISTVRNCFDVGTRAEYLIDMEKNKEQPNSKNNIVYETVVYKISFKDVTYFEKY